MQLWMEFKFWLSQPNFHFTRKSLSKYQNFAYIYVLFKKLEILNKIFTFIKRGKILPSHEIFIVLMSTLFPNYECTWNEGGENGAEAIVPFSINPSMPRQKQHERAVDTGAAPSPSTLPETNPFIWNGTPTGWSYRHHTQTGNLK